MPKMPREQVCLRNAKKALFGRFQPYQAIGSAEYTSEDDLPFSFGINYDRHGKKDFFLLIELVNLPVVCGYPQMARLIFYHFVDPLIPYLIFIPRRRLEWHKGTPIETVYPIPRSKPHKAFPVFKHGRYPLMGKPLLGGIIFDLAPWLRHRAHRKK
jgi:hypothetical protein